MKKQMSFILVLVIAVCLFLPSAVSASAGDIGGHGYEAAVSGGGFIEWVDFNASKDIMERALDGYNALAPGLRARYGFCEMMAYVATKNGNNFRQSADRKTLSGFIKSVNAGEDPTAAYADNKYYKYYLESYHAVFDGMIGEYTDAAGGGGGYGVRGYCPIAKGFYYTDYDDFGNSRSFGYKRRHLGHDMMGAIGTPIVAAEGGVVKELGWNKYGGWRVGIRSFDGRRYYYYAHMRKGRPYAAGLEKGAHVRPGEVIGYLGNTGYSNTEDKNMAHSTNPHLHFGMQLIFDESQVEGASEIWIDVYALTRFLAAHRRAKVTHDENYEYYSQDLINVIY